MVPGRSELIDEGQNFSVIVDAADTPEVGNIGVMLIFHVHLSVCCSVRNLQRWGVKTQGFLIVLLIVLICCRGAGAVFLDSNLLYFST